MRVLTVYNANKLRLIQIRNNVADLLASTDNYTIYSVIHPYGHTDIFKQKLPLRWLPSKPAVLPTLQGKQLSSV